MKKLSLILALLLISPLCFAEESRLESLKAERQKIEDINKKQIEEVNAYNQAKQKEMAETVIRFHEINGAIKELESKKSEESK